MSKVSDERELREFLLALNVAAEPLGITYSIQTDYRYVKTEKKMFVTTKIYKFLVTKVKTSVLEHRYIDNFEDEADYIAEQMELLESNPKQFRVPRGKVSSQKYLDKHKI